MSDRPLVEVLGFPGCPNVEPTLKLVAQTAVAAGVEPDVRVIEVESPEAAERLRFLGSPSVRVGGRDVEPGADERGTYAYACRVYETPAGRQGVPEASWIVAALGTRG